MNIERRKVLTMLNSMKIESMVDYYVRPENIEEILDAINFAREKKLRFFILGNGTNTLFAKTFYKNTMFIDLKALNKIRIENGYIAVEAGVTGKRFLNFCLNHSIKNYEFLAGIPGTIGGMVFMNAGAFGDEIGNYVKEIKVIDIDLMKTITIEKKFLNFSYRKLDLEKKIILEAIFDFQQGDLEEIRDRMKKNLMKRKEKQPIGFSLGSVFKNGAGYFAGELIEKAGLKGVRIGDVFISNKHANFIINSGRAKGIDVIKLIHKIEREVFDKFSVYLLREINVLF